MKNRIVAVQQEGKSDCGPACIATILKYYGKHVSLARIKQYTGTDNMGTSGRGMIKGLKHFGFNTHGIKINKFSEISKMSFPSIAHVNSNKLFEHYVVIFEAGKNYIKIGDPLVGVRNLSKDEFMKITTGIFLNVFPTKVISEISPSPSSIKRIISLVKKYRLFIISVMMLTIVSGALSFITSFFIKIIVDTIIPMRRYNNLFFAGICFLILNILLVIVDFIKQCMIVHISRKVDVDIMSLLYNKVLNLPYNYFLIKNVGDITSRFEDANNIRELTTVIFLNMIVDSFMVFGSSCLLIIIDYKLFLLMIVPVCLYILTIVYFEPYIKNQSMILLNKSNVLKSFLIEMIRNIESIKSFQLEKLEKKKSVDLQRDLSMTTEKLSRKISLQISLQQAIRTIFNVLLLWIGSYQVLNGNITLGYLLAFNTIVNYFFSPVERLIQNQSKILNAKASSDRIDDILDVKSEKLVQNYKAQFVPTFNQISFEKVNFRYNERNLAIDGISFNVDGVKRIGIVGSSGSGKTTIAKLLLKFLEPEKGVIKIDNVPIKDIGIYECRHNISYVSQDVKIFNGSFYENFLSNDISEIDFLCKALGLKTFISSLPNGYNTKIEENGNNLSGGQKQKISIIRAILKHPRLLILDEATSNIDTLGEASLDKVLDSMNCVIIKIAHRLRTIKNCDKIFVMDKGKIVESGTHSELANNEGSLYYSFLQADR